MNASFELCEELYRLSGWDDQLFWYIRQSVGEWEINYCPNNAKKWVQSDEFHKPAYDLGYLLRKLPQGEIRNRSGRYTAWQNNPANVAPIEADTPEDATAKLAIHLFKTNVLKREV